MESILLRSLLLPSFNVALSEGLYFRLPNNWAVILSVKLRLPLSSPTRSCLNLHIIKVVPLTGQYKERKLMNTETISSGVSIRFLPSVSFSPGIGRCGWTGLLPVSCPGLTGVD